MTKTVVVRECDSLAEELIYSLVKQEGVRGLATALNNAFAFGSLIEDRYRIQNQAALDKCFEGIERFKEAADLLED